jgi:hypothetical protein
VKTPSWFRRARASWMAGPYVFVALSVTFGALHGEPIWAKALWASTTLVLYFASWKLADIIVNLRARRIQAR